MAQDLMLRELKSILNSYLDSIAGSSLTFIATLDGHLLLERSRDGGSAELSAPMAGSLLGISDSVARNLASEDVEDALIMMESHLLALFKIQDPQSAFYLGFLAPKQTNLGKLIHNGKSTAAAIKALLPDAES